MAPIVALLLAAGESTRMGELKALLPWQGATLIEHQVTALASASVSHTIVVLGHQSDRLALLLKGRAGVQYAYNPDYRQGKTTSIKAGIRALRSARNSPLVSSGKGSILVLNVDQPRSAGIIRRVIELHTRPGESSPSDQASLITVPTHRGKGGHPVILSMSLADELMEISEDTLGLKAVMRRHEGETQRVELDSPEVLLDLNTPQDYREALGMSAPE